MLIGAGLLIAGVAGIPAVIATAQGGPPPPSSGTVLASGLSSTGGAVGPDGAFYVAQAGTGGPTEIIFPDDIAELFGADKGYFGFTGGVARVDPATGDVTTMTGLPSGALEPGGEGSGAADVAFMGDTMYVLITGGLNYVGGAAADYPNGIYRHDGGTSWTVVADLSAFNDANPVDFPDAAPGGNPFALDVRGSEFIISDGNYNRLLRATTDGEVSILASFDNVVPTGLATRDSGPVYNTWFSAFPHAPGDSFVVTVGVPTGAVTQVADTFAQLIDVEFGAGGTYVLQFGDQSLSEEEPPPPGRLLRLNGSELETVVTGLFLPTSVSFSGDTAFVTSLAGDVIKIDGVSALAPIEEEQAPEPTPAPAPSPTAPIGPITPPNTGSGGMASGGMPVALIIALAGAGLTMASAGGLVAVRQR
jgi:hypothetical protein